MPRPNNRLYDLLEVSPSTTRQGLKHSFRRITKRLQARSDDASRERLDEVIEAYEVLADPEARRLYDQFGEAAFEPGFVPPPSAAPTPPPPPPQPHPYPQAPPPPPPTYPPPPPRHHHPPPQQQPVYGQDPAQWQEPQGGPPPAHTQPRYVDPNQAGAPAFGGAQLGGPAYQPPPQPQSHAPIEVWISFKRSCVGGDAQVMVGDEFVTLPIPIGIADGSLIEVRGRVFAIRVEPHDIFDRDGDDLYATYTLEEHEAARGCDIVIPTLGKHVKIKVPPGAETGQKLRLAGKGLPLAEPGDLYIKLYVRPRGAPRVPGEVPGKKKGGGGGDGPSGAPALD